MMKNYLIYIFALLTIVFSSCAVNEELVMLDEVDDLYIQPDNNLFTTASASINDGNPAEETMYDASDAEMSYYQNTPYNAADETNRTEAETKNTDSEEEYYDYYDEDYAGRIQNFHSPDNQDYYYGGNNYPVTSNWPRFNWSMNYGFSSFGYGTRSGFGMGMGFGNGFNNRFYDPFYDPFFDPFYSPWRNPHMNYWNRTFYCGPGWGWGGGFGSMNPYWNGYNPYFYNPYAYNPYFYGGSGIIDGTAGNNYNYNDQPSSRRRSRGGIVNNGDSGSGSGSDGSGIVVDRGTERRGTTPRTDARTDRTERTRNDRTPRSESVYRREATSRTDRSDFNRRTDVSNSSRYVRQQRNDASNFTRSRVAPSTRERTNRVNRPTNSYYNNSSRPRMNGNNSYYGSPSRSRTSSPSFSSPSRSTGTSSPSRSTGTRRR